MRYTFLFIWNPFKPEAYLFLYFFLSSPIICKTKFYNNKKAKQNNWKKCLVTLYCHGWWKRCFYRNSTAINTLILVLTTRRTYHNSLLFSLFPIPVLFITPFSHTRSLFIYFMSFILCLFSSFTFNFCDMMHLLLKTWYDKKMWKKKFSNITTWKKKNRRRNLKAPVNIMLSFIFFEPTEETRKKT